jgi:hypothetical protein
LKSIKCQPKPEGTCNFDEVILEIVSRVMQENLVFFTLGAPEEESTWLCDSIEAEVLACPEG